MNTKVKSEKTKLEIFEALLSSFQSNLAQAEEDFDKGDEEVLAEFNITLEKTCNEWRKKYMEAKS